MSYDEFARFALELEDTYGAPLFVQVEYENGDIDEYNTADYSGYDNLIESIDGSDDADTVRWIEIVGYECPECNDIVYRCDWNSDAITVCCPICGYEFESGEE